MVALTTLYAASPLDLSDDTRLSFAQDANDTQTAALDNVDADFGNMDTLTFNVEYSMNNAPSNDVYSLGIRIISGATILAAADAGGTVQVIDSNVTNTVDAYSGATAFSYVNTAASKTLWDAATVELSQTYTKTAGSDRTFIRVDHVIIDGTYTQSGGATITGTGALASGGVTIASTGERTSSGTGALTIGGSFMAAIQGGVSGLTTIQTDGWRGTYNSPPAEFDPIASPETVSVTRSGFDATGSPASPVDVLTIMKRVREPYPDQATLTATDVALSDFVYSGDVISGVTNNSTRAAPKPICMWLDHDLQRCTTGIYTAKLAVAHAHARNGRPVAAVKFIASDGTTTVEHVVSAMTTTAYTASGLSVPHFEAALNFATLTDDAMITIDVIVYPWVGAAYQASVDGATYPSINFTTMKVLNDVNYGTAYAYVDGVGGGTPAVSTNAATAQANPYATIAAAASAIQTYNNTNFSRNNASGGIIRLESGTHSHSSYSSVAVGDIPLEVEAASSANKATTIYQDAGASVSNGIPDRLKVKDVVVQRSGASDYIFFDNSAASGSAFNLIFENVTFDDNGVGVFYAAMLYRVGFCSLIECDATALGVVQNFSTVNKMTNIIGCGDLLVQNGAYNVVGTKMTETVIDFDQFAAANRETPAGTFYGFNFLATSNVNPMIGNGIVIGDAGLAFVGNVCERVSGTNALLRLNADSNVNAAQNCVISQNTFVGERVNFLYSNSAATEKIGYYQNNVAYQWNVKTDVFATNGTYTGNWPVVYHVGHRNNAYLSGSNSGDTFGVGFWLGDVAGLNSVTGTDAVPIEPDWADDASNHGTGLGGGDYSPGALTELQTVPANETPYPTDLYGNVINIDGTAYVGGQQPAASVISGSGSLTTGGAALAATGERVIVGTGALAAGGVTLAATGTRTVTGSATLSIGGAQLSATGAATGNITGTGASTAGAVTLSAAGVREATGTATLTTGGALIAATGAIGGTVSGTGALAAGAVTLSASGLRKVTGSGALILGGSLLSASGLREVTGSGSVTMGGALLSASGVRKITGAASFTIGPALISAIGATGGAIAGSGALSVGPALLQSAGVRSSIGTGQLSLGGVSVASIAKLGFSGTGQLTLGGAFLASIAERGVNGLGQLALGGVLISSTGLREIKGSGALSIGPVFVSVTAETGLQYFYSFPEDSERVGTLIDYERSGVLILPDRDGTVSKYEV